MHVREHCKTPSTLFRRAGSVWVCTCGQMYVLRWFGGYGTSFKAWESCTPPAPVEDDEPIKFRTPEYKD